MNSLSLRNTDVLDSSTTYTLRELCNHGGIHPEWVITLVNYGVISPIKESADYQWLFNTTALLRIERALRLQRDFEINPSGIAILLDLLDETNQLRRKVEQMNQLIVQLTETD